MEQWLDIGDKLGSAISGVLALATALASIALYYRSKIQTSPRLYYKVDDTLKESIHIIIWNDGIKKIFLKDFIKEYKPKFLINSAFSAPVTVNIVYKSGFHQLDAQVNEDNEIIIDFDFIPTKNYFVLNISPKIKRSRIALSAEFKDSGEVKEIPNFLSDTSNILVAVLSILLALFAVYFNLDFERLHDEEYRGSIAAFFFGRLLIFIILLPLCALPTWKMKMLFKSFGLSYNHEVLIPIKNSKEFKFIVLNYTLLKEKVLKFLRS